jgi:nucleoside-diphosphate-sugar epimerase
MVTRLKEAGVWVRGVDLKLPEFDKTDADEFFQLDLRDQRIVQDIFRTGFDEVYQFAADMGGAGYVFTGENDAQIMQNSASINLNVAKTSPGLVGKVFFSSSACVYPAYNQTDPSNPLCSEESAYPAEPDSDYGWEKLFSERLYLAAMKNNGLQVRVARFHNIFGPKGTWQGGKEKAPAAICRKVALADKEIEIWGDGEQTRSFLYITECLEGVSRLMTSDFVGPVNIGSEEMVTINQLVDMVCEIAGKTLTKRHIPGPTGVRGRNSDNRLIYEKLGWRPTASLEDGLETTYRWIQNELLKK